MSEDVEDALKDLEASISLMTLPLPSSERRFASQLVLGTEALLQAIHTGSVDATPDQVGRITVCQAAMRIAMESEVLP